MPRRYFAILLVLLALPLFSTPLLLGAATATSPLRLFAWSYPFYLIASAWCAWRVYPRRPDLAWILAILMVLSTAAMWWLASHPELIAPL